MSNTVQIDNVCIVVSAIESIDHRDQAALVVVTLASGKAFTFAHASEEASAETFKSLKWLVKGETGTAAELRTV
ncbi:hypothetical protein [Stenotrophomonas sp. GZD-301]|uniref:hypothetical protein n=1 Tax=Stenotrophomonas sp. GZD-301 TaxID=3404814 RepID=UPI003BB65CB1